jgi:hypothetical protein
MSQVTPGNTKDNPRSINTKKSCYSLTTKHALYTPHFRNQRPYLRPVDLNGTMRSSHSGTKLLSNHSMPKIEHSIPKRAKRTLTTKKQHLNFSGVNAQWQNSLVERSNGTLCATARSVLNHAISKWDKTITAELWPFAIQHTATIYNTTKRLSRDYNISPWEQFTGERSKLDQNDMHPLFCPVYVLDRRMQEGTSPPKWRKGTTQKVYV